MLHAVRRHGRTDTVVLYWFRTPPYIKVGRTALDEDARQQLEALYPDITFDWNRILREPPQPLPEREAFRRKEQRDARDARRKRKRPAEPAPSAEPLTNGNGGAGAEEPMEGSESDFHDADAVQNTEEGGTPAEPTGESAAATAASVKRRRRRRRRKRGGGTPSNGSV